MFHDPKEIVVDGQATLELFKLSEDTTYSHIRTHSSSCMFVCVIVTVSSPYRDPDVIPTSSNEAYHTVSQTGGTTETPHTVLSLHLSFFPGTAGEV